MLTDEDKQWINERLERLESALKDYINERTYDGETRVIRSFSDYNESIQLRFRKLEADTSNIGTASTERLAVFERRLADLTARILLLERPAKSSGQ